MVTIPCGTTGINDVYGGANEALITGDVTLNILGGSMNRVFGGSRNAMIDGNVTVNITGGSIDTVFGGNNVDGNITGQIDVNIDWGNNTCTDSLYIGTVFGGGNEARYTPTSAAIVSPSVSIVKATISEDIFGGGNGTTRTDSSDARVTANPSVLVGAPRFADTNGAPLAQAVDCDTVTVNGSIYGGGNASPTVGNTTVVVRGEKTLVRNSVYGAGNAATMGYATATDTSTTDVHIGYYAGTTDSVSVSVSDGKLSATCATPGAVIRYTIGDTDPSVGEIYSAPIPVSSGKTVKLRATRGGYEPSALTTYTEP